jgi:HD-GYP domain-containing protein (c-di-GMP phosphodiesterase class II)
MCVPLVVFHLHQARDVDLYIWPDGDDEPTLYCGADVMLTQQDLDRLLERGVRALYVSDAAHADLSQQLMASLSDVLSDESTAAEERLAVLQTAMAMEVDAAFHTIDCDRFVSLSHEIAGQINTLLSSNNIIPSRLVQMLRHDFYTFTHIMNVATYATLMAGILGVSAEEQHQITVGGLLHDIGKRFIPATILCKKSKLDDKEWEVIRSHPQRGYEDLCERDDLNSAQLLMVYSHHERIDGKGYPVGLVGDEIHPWARLLTVVDVFDALTGARPYRGSWKVKDALSYLERNSGTQFDGEMVKCWLAAMNRN